MAAARPLSEQARNGIVYHARECEQSLRCAAFAEEQGMSAGMAGGFRKMAAYHSQHAFDWAGVDTEARA